MPVANRFLWVEGGRKWRHSDSGPISVLLYKARYLAKVTLSSIERAWPTKGFIAAELILRIHPHVTIGSSWMWQVSPGRLEREHRFPFQFPYFLFFKSLLFIGIRFLSFAVVWLLHWHVMFIHIHIRPISTSFNLTAPWSLSFPKFASYFCPFRLE